MVPSKMLSDGAQCIKCYNECYSAYHTKLHIQQSVDLMH